MFSRDLFYKIHARLLETLCLPHLFVVLGDFQQLPSVRGKPVYALIDNHERIEGFLIWICGISSSLLS